MTQLYSERHGGEVHLGKIGTGRAPRGAVKFADIKTDLGSGVTLPTPPTNWGWSGDFSRAGWGIDGNGPAQAGSKIPSQWAAAQGAGDCWWAFIAHLIRERAKNAGRPTPPISDLTTITQYGQGTGYNPKTGSGDNGTDPAQGYEYLAQHPFLDDNGKPHPFELVIQVEPGNITDLYQAAWLFEGAGVGIQFQQAQMDQFNAGEPWQYVKGSSVEGGHEILVFRKALITWGTVVPFLASLITNLNDETQCSISLEMFNSVTGEDVSSINNADLTKYAQILASRYPQS